MKLSIFSYCLLFSFFSIAQQKEFYRNTTFFGNYHHVVTEHFSSPNGNPLRETFGFSAGVEHDFVVAPAFHLDVKLGYRFVNEYAEASPGFVFQYNSDDNVLSNYHGAFTGLGFNFGRRHLWESALIIGGGVKKAPNYSNASAEMELGLQTGYKYIARNGLTFKTGVSVNFARNGFFSRMYTGYFGLGYTIQKSQGFVQSERDKIGEKEKPYFAINATGYLGSLTLELIGAKIEFEHFVFNGPKVDLGYGLTAGVGGIYDEGESFSLTPKFIGLFGGGDNKLEFSIGPHIPFIYIKSPLLSWYELIHAGIGWRFTPKDIPIILRIGSATTSMLYGSIGFRLGK